MENITGFTKENLFPVVIMLMNKTPGVGCEPAQGHGLGEEGMLADQEESWVS